MPRKTWYVRSALTYLMLLFNRWLLPVIALVGSSLLPSSLQRNYNSRRFWSNCKSGGWLSEGSTCSVGYLPHRYAIPDWPQLSEFCLSETCCCSDRGRCIATFVVSTSTDVLCVWFSEKEVGRRSMTHWSTRTQFSSRRTYSVCIRWSTRSPR